MPKSGLLLVGILGALGACEILSPSTAPFTDCYIQQITGTWRLSHIETDGSCGPLADLIFASVTGFDQTVYVDCNVMSELMSEDQCTVDTAFRCPLGDGEGTEDWAVSLRMIDYDTLEGGGTVEILSPGGNCRSSYSMTMIKTAP